MPCASGMLVAMARTQEACMLSRPMFRLACCFLLLPITGLPEPTLAAQEPAPTATTASVGSAPTEVVITEFSPPPEIAAKATAYRSALHRHFFLNTFYGALALLVVLSTGVAALYRNWAERASRRRFVQVLIFAPLLLLTVSVLNLPTSISDQLLELRFGRSVQKWP